MTGDPRPDLGDRPVVIVDGTPIPLWPWSTWRDAATARDAVFAAALREGDMWIEDAVGEPVDPDGAVVDGAAITIRMGVG